MDRYGDREFRDLHGGPSCFDPVQVGGLYLLGEEVYLRVLDVTETAVVVNLYWLCPYHGLDFRYTGRIKLTDFAKKAEGFN